MSASGRRRLGVALALLASAAGWLATSARPELSQQPACTRPAGWSFPPASALWVSGNKWRFHFFLDFPDKSGEAAQISFSGFAGSWQISVKPSSDGYVHASSFGPVTTWDSDSQDHTQYADVTVGSCSFEVSIDSLHLNLTPFHVVALGDSYSSGEGNPPFSVQACHTSEQAWPYWLGNDHFNFDVRDLACSGAKIADLGSNYRKRPSQLSSISEIAKTDPLNYVTVTIGGNDVGFGPVLKDCFLPRHNCVRDGVALVAMKKAKQLGPRLTSLYTSLKWRVQAWTRVLVVGYPQIFPDVTDGTYNCSWLAPEEQNVLNGIAKLLDQTIAKAAAKAGVDYVSTLDVLNRHELCTRNAWVMPIGHKPLVYDGHPNLQGQRAIAESVRDFVRSHLDYYRFWP